MPAPTSEGRWLSLPTQQRMFVSRAVVRNPTRRALAGTSPDSGHVVARSAGASFVRLQAASPAFRNESIPVTFAPAKAARDYGVNDLRRAKCDADRRDVRVEQLERVLGGLRSRAIKRVKH